jgi:alginate O-acetyltransferase complex protein AlgJ
MARCRELLHGAFDMNREMSRLGRVVAIVPSSNHFLVVAFVIVITAPGITLFFTNGAEEIRAAEYRDPAEFPRLFVKHIGPIPRPSKSSLRNFPGNFEIWFNDHRGLRGPLLGLHSRARLAGLVGSGMAQLSIGHKGSNGVVVGREGWLFLASEAIIRDYQRSRPLTVDELEAWKQALNARRDWFAERGIEYLLVIAPNKGEIYSEYLPRALNPVSGVRRLDQVVEYCGGEDGVEIVDLREPLLVMKSRHQLYDKTDTHWNALGAFVGYHAIMQAVAEKMKGHPALPLEDFQIEKGELQVRDLGRMLGGNFTEQGLSLKPLRLPNWQIVTTQTATQVPESSRYPLPKESCYIPATNPQADRPNIVVLHDSFMRALAGFLNEHFQRVCYKRRREDQRDPFPAELIERERPTMVIEEMVQRRLQYPPLILPPPGDVIASRPEHSGSASR